MMVEVLLDAPLVDERYTAADEVAAACATLGRAAAAAVNAEAVARLNAGLVDLGFAFAVVAVDDAAVERVDTPVTAVAA